MPDGYDRVLKHIAGHQITVHCTITRQQIRRDGYLEEFVPFWSANSDTRQIWASLYTPQLGEDSAECLTREDRARVVAQLLDLWPRAVWDQPSGGRARPWPDAPPGRVERSRG